LHTLLFLVEKNKMDIFDIPIASITDQYLDILASTEFTDMDTLSDFLTVAAALLRIKSLMLLPKDEDDEDGAEELEDPRAELARNLLELKRFRQISELMREMRTQASGVYFRNTPVLDDDILRIAKDIEKAAIDPALLLAHVPLPWLRDIYRKLLRYVQDRVDPIRSRFDHVEREEVTLASKMSWLKELAKAQGEVYFSQISDKLERIERIVLVLCVLELAKNGHVSAEQNSLFGEIVIRNLGNRD
jgi:segregation and condensation protein A